MRAMKAVFSSINKALFVVVVMLCVSVEVHASNTDQTGDPSTIVDSTNPFFNILRQELSPHELDLRFEYVPEYGLQINS